MPDCFENYSVSLSAPLGEPHSGVRPTADDRFGWCVSLVTGLKDAALPDGECKDLSKVVDHLIWNFNSVQISSTPVTAINPL